MNNRILFQCFNLMVFGLGVAGAAACAAGNDGGEGGGGNISSTAGVGAAGPGETSSSTTGTATTGSDAAGTSAASSGTGVPPSTSSVSTTSSTGSSSGEGGSGAAPPTDVTMIDDMEDGDNAITVTDGRQGYWYTYNDETEEGATQTPVAGDDFTMTTLSPPRGASMVAANTKGSGFTKWGAGMGFDLNSAEGVKSTYDASAFRGVTFWAKATAASSKALKVLLGDANTTPVAEGGVCESGCYNHFARSVSLTEEWQQFTVEFAEPLDPKTLIAIQFQASARDAFDIYVDDVGFYK